ncbi:hypothetical protein [Actinoplanes sp. NPDC049599]
MVIALIDCYCLDDRADQLSPLGDRADRLSVFVAALIDERPARPGGK